MNASEEDRMKQLLRQALPPIGAQAGPERDLWPAMLRKFDERPARVPWFDWVLAGGLAAFVAAFPAAVPLLLYNL